MKFSIIIPVRSINNFLKENIYHLRRLDYSNFEVIIILDQGEEFDFGNDTRFRFVVSGSKGPGEKRNIGAKEAEGDILVFLDDDAYPRKDWLTFAQEMFENEQVYALGAPAVTPENASFLESMSGKVLESWLSGGGTVYRHIPDRLREVDDYPTVNLFVRKSAFLDVGGFTTAFWPGEDTKLCLDLVKKFGRKFFYDPRPIVFHHRRRLFLPHLKQVSRFGQHRGQFARIFPETSRLPMYFVPSLFVCGLIFGFFASLIFPYLKPIYWSVVISYLALLVLESTKVAMLEKSLVAGFCVGMGIFLTHIIYGVNFVIGFLRRPELKLRNFDEKTGNYLGG